VRRVASCITTPFMAFGLAGNEFAEFFEVITIRSDVSSRLRATVEAEPLKARSTRSWSMRRRVERSLSSGV